MESFICSSGDALTYSGVLNPSIPAVPFAITTRDAKKNSPLRVFPEQKLRSWPVAALPPRVLWRAPSRARRRPPNFRTEASGRWIYYRWQGRNHYWFAFSCWMRLSSGSDCADVRSIIRCTCVGCMSRSRQNITVAPQKARDNTYLELSLIGGNRVRVWRAGHIRGWCSGAPRILAGPRRRRVYKCPL
ncbi:hypothetical protein OBBRIDRAFT_212782 [Obba rivulosa]|uniref:Uncharacterized protein n=1 Tax=Obba rivulosa TaxID=1052685 RepID=A0A8E2AL60_9APHY|nr:hypothetical protein OBBRIDRAFT_212782 [Obba rivulosa]